MGQVPEGYRGLEMTYAPPPPTHQEFGIAKEGRSHGEGRRQPWRGGKKLEENESSRNPFLSSAFKDPVQGV